MLSVPPPPEGTAPEQIAKALLRDFKPRVKLYPANCLDVLEDMDGESIHLIVTDPPYFLDGLDDGWRKGDGGARGTGTVGGLPVGMKFDPKQGRKLQDFLSPINDQLIRVLKPGGFMLMFAAPRLFHRTAIAAEDAGFEVRDQYAWHFRTRAQCKAFSMNHFISRNPRMTGDEKEAAIKHLGGRKTPQLRPQFESILCAQKPKTGTFVENWMIYGTGLIDADQTLSGTRPATVMHVEKPNKAKFNDHLTPKPVRLCEHLIRLFSLEGQTVLDPFVGSGTTCISARRARRHSIGIDVKPEYIQIAKSRIEGES